MYFKVKACTWSIIAILLVNSWANTNSIIKLQTDLDVRFFCRDDPLKGTSHLFKYPLSLFSSTLPKAEIKSLVLSLASFLLLFSSLFEWPFSPEICVCVCIVLVLYTILFSDSCPGSRKQLATNDVVFRVGLWEYIAQDFHSRIKFIVDDNTWICQKINQLIN